MDPGYFDIERKQNPREKANLISKTSFWYTKQLFEKGRKGQLSISDVYRCTPGHRAAPRDKNKKPSLLRCIISLYGLKFIVTNFIFAIIDTFFRPISTLWALYASLAAHSYIESFSG
ncbi:unnamed protein product [Leptidea sinapis]|uniref:Uncharacterized protein n=1 Tax=Leptidea sinapis TaxID=189913 RepID=A0A5E4QH34_9NEOP|nr:unnamed protein product [Leptidea sinapis]